MVYCLQASLSFATVARRDSVLSAAQNRVESHPRWGVTTIESRTAWSTGDPALYIEARFNARADADDVWARILSVTANRTPRAGSTLTLHTCTHDEDTDECVIVETQEW